MIGTARLHGQQEDLETRGRNGGRSEEPSRGTNVMMKTLTYDVTGPGSLIGASGHDYSVKPAAAAPERAIWALLLIGFAAAGFVRLRPAKAAFI